MNEIKNVIVSRFAEDVHTIIDGRRNFEEIIFSKLVRYSV